MSFNLSIGFLSTPQKPKAIIVSWGDQVDVIYRNLILFAVYPDTDFEQLVETFIKTTHGAIMVILKSKVTIT